MVNKDVSEDRKLGIEGGHFAKFGLEGGAEAT